MSVTCDKSVIFSDLKYNHIGGLMVRVLNMSTRQIVDIPEIQSPRWSNG
jgi:hypothetical protein